MATDIILKDTQGTDVIYEGVSQINVLNTDGEPVVFSDNESINLLQTQITENATSITQINETINNLDNTYAKDTDLSALDTRVTALEEGGTGGGGSTYNPKWNTLSGDGAFYLNYSGTLSVANTNSSTYPISHKDVYPKYIYKEITESLKGKWRQFLVQNCEKPWKLILTIGGSVTEVTAEVWVNKSSGGSVGDIQLYGQTNQDLFKISCSSGTTYVYIYSTRASFNGLLGVNVAYYG